MTRRLSLLVLAGLLAGGSTACGPTNDEAAKPVIKLSSAEIATLLGISEASGVKIGAVASDRDGVRVDSISFEDGKGRELDVQEVELKIASTADMVYSVSSLVVKRLELNDLKNSQRTKVFGVNVVEPGKGFLVQIESAIASVKSGGSLKTSGLSFAKLTIDRIDYLIRTEDANVTKITVDGILIDKASKDTVDDMRIGRVTIGETAAVENLRFRVVNRIWADKVLALLVKLPQAASIKWADEAIDLGGRVVPFDGFSVDKMTFRFKLSEKKTVAIDVAGLNFDVQRDSNHEFLGVVGKVNLEVPVTSFPDEMTSFIRAMGNRKTQNSLTCAVRMEMTRDPSTETERFENLAIDVPEMFLLTGSLGTRKVADLIGKLFSFQFDQNFMPLDKNLTVGISSLKVEYKDQGLVSYLASPRYQWSKDFKDQFDDLPGNWAKGAEAGRLGPEVRRFLADPGRVSLSASTAKVVPMEAFLDGIGGTTRPGEKVATRLEFFGK